MRFDRRNCGAVGDGFTRAGRLGRRGGSDQPDYPDKVVGGGHQVASHLGLFQAEIACASEAADRFHPTEDLFNSFANSLVGSLMIIFVLMLIGFSGALR